MIENLIESKDYKYTIFDKYICSQNIDRIKFYKNEEKNNRIKALSAGYHLNKETQKKTGGIFFFDISESKKLVPLESENILLDYGILDIKFSKDNSLIFTANSDYSYTIFNIKNNSQNKRYLIENNEEKLKITNDVIEIDTKEEKIFLGANDGQIFIEDLATQKNILSIPNAHDYGIWSIYLFNENTFLSGGEDAQIKLWDIRSKEGNIEFNNKKSNNKSYQSSINYIGNLKCDLSNNILLTGSYDEKIILFDIRNFPKELKSIKTEHSVWDVKQSCINNQNLLLMSSIYEGFNIWEIEHNDYNIKHVLRLPVTKNKDLLHGTIVYGIDIKNKDNNSIDILSCSFYDNLMMYWNYSKI